MKIKNVVFDLDGTLINSLGITTKIFLDIVRQELDQDLEMKDVTQYFGLPEETIAQSLFPGAVGERVFELYIERLSERLQDVVLFEGIQTMLDELSTNYHPLALYTARGIRATRMILKHLNMDRYFEMVITGSEVKNGKPHIEGLERVIQHLQLKPKHTVYMGDSEKDILMAKQMGCVAVAVGWCPFLDKKTLQEAKPDAFLTHPKQILSFLQSYTLSP